MKILKKSTLILLLISLLGCSKDENSVSNTTFSNLIGKWEAVSYSYQGSTSYQSIGTNNSWETSYYADAWLLDFYLEIIENPNDYSVIGTHKIDYYYTDEYGNQYYYVGDQIKNEIGAYIRNSNNHITFTFDNEIKHGIILQLDNTTLKINISDSNSEVNEDNILVTKVRDENYVFKRLE